MPNVPKGSRTLAKASTIQPEPWDNRASTISLTSLCPCCCDRAVGQDVSQTEKALSQFKRGVGDGREKS